MEQYFDFNILIATFIKKTVDKNGLIARLKSLGAFWSYNISSLVDMPDNVLIEECLRWGDVFELIQLFKIFPIIVIRKVWQERLIPDERLYPHNYYLAIVFFNIKNPELYIRSKASKLSRYERIKQSTP